MEPSRLIFKGRVQLPEVLDGGWARSGELDTQGDFFSQDGALCGAGSWRFARNTGFVLTGIFETHPQ
jgi:hypothetical protein